MQQQKHKALNELGETCTADREEIKRVVRLLIKSDGGSDIDKEEIVKEVKKVKRQNSVTYWLLSIMIFLTVAGQDLRCLSEGYSKLKMDCNHPFKCTWEDCLQGC